jgi:hypothetical protein
MDVLINKSLFLLATDMISLTFTGTFNITKENLVESYSHRWKKGKNKKKQEYEEEEEEAAIIDLNTIGGLESGQVFRPRHSKPINKAIIYPDFIFNRPSLLPWVMGSLQKDRGSWLAWSL